VTYFGLDRSARDEDIEVALPAAAPLDGLTNGGVSL
jgi:hypothetical protein